MNNERKKGNMKYRCLMVSLLFLICGRLCAADAYILRGCEDTSSELWSGNWSDFRKWTVEYPRLADDYYVHNNSLLFNEGMSIQAGIE